MSFMNGYKFDLFDGDEIKILIIHIKWRKHMNLVTLAQTKGVELM